MRSNHQLIQDFKNGDATAFSKILELNQDYIYTLTYSILKNREEAQEVTQDTFIKAYKNLAKYNEEAKLRSWLYKIAYRTALDKIRQRKKSIGLNEVGFSQEYTQSLYEDNLERKELSGQLEKAISYLNPKEAAILKLFYLEEKNIKELVLITSYSESNIKVILFRARKNLATVIKERFTEVENYLIS